MQRLVVLSVLVEKARLVQLHHHPVIAKLVHILVGVVVHVVTVAVVVEHKVVHDHLVWDLGVQIQVNLNPVREVATKIQGNVDFFIVEAQMIVVVAGNEEAVQAVDALG